ncbi:membrane protein required for colicin V production [Oceanimonas baumannii]|uniref:Membrane protein required for colicin V production n=2 Tax=Oceanimonas baumannii TaxID=129578 RepID=A0ABY2F2U3_9GAMM|nr:membrane protein required for colicin V production [Oceanimonas baumannii]
MRGNQEGFGTNMMVWIDFVILGIIGLSALISLVRGFVKEAMSLATWVTAFFIASRFYADLAVFLDITDPLFRNGAAIAILFVLTLILGALVNYIIGELVIRTGLSGTDRVLGVCFGAVRGVFIVAALLLFSDTMTAFSHSPWWKESVLIPEFGIVIQWFFNMLQNSSSFLPPKL